MLVQYLVIKQKAFEVSVSFESLHRPYMNVSF